MKFHSLIAAALLLLAFDSGAAPQAASSTSAGQDAHQAFTYRNGELVLDIRDSAGAEVLRTSLAYFFHDEHIATANELPAGPVEAIPMQGQLALTPLHAQPEDAPLTEPLSLGLLGAGIAVLGWTRRQGSWVDRLLKQPGAWDIFPWPALSWLD